MDGGGWLTFLIVIILASLLPTFVALRGKRAPGGWWGLLGASLVGAYIGGRLLGQWWWVIGGFNVIGGLLGGLILGYGLQLLGTQAKPEEHHAGHMH